jgi:catechol 2,3-dioxygenase-like lactoylglutathione lyase family enzyme
MSYTISKLTPNLVVTDVDRSVGFYRDVLGFEVQVTVPDTGPFVFAAVTSGPVEIFLNARDAAVAEYPAFRDRPVGGTLTLFLEVTGVEAAHEALGTKVRIVMPLEKKWYGSTEFAFLDPDGYVITFAERTGQAE